MKKLLFATLIILTLTACGSVSSSPQVESSRSAGSLPAATQLIVGTMKLDGMEQDVTAEQATQLLPLWQVYQSLSTSDTAAQEEVDSLVEQIKETMTAEQMQAIENMQLTQEDLFALMQEQGINMGGGQNLSPEQIATAQALRNSGGGGFVAPESGGPGGDFVPPQGGFPGGGGGGGFGNGQGGQNLNPDQIATAQAARGTNNAGLNRVPPSVLNALIQFLEKKAGL